MSILDSDVGLDVDGSSGWRVDRADVTDDDDDDRWEGRIDGGGITTDDDDDGDDFMGIDAFCVPGFNGVVVPP